MSQHFQASLIGDASHLSKQIFADQAQDVLKTCSSTYLKRRVGQKIRNELSNLSDESLTRGDSISLLSKFDVSLEITEQDVIDCHAFTKRVGFQWEKILRCSGYSDYANVLLGLVERGAFLVGSSSTDCTRQAETDIIEDNRRISNFATLDAALNSIRRSQSDCSGSGQPPKHITTTSNVDSNSVSSVKKAIQQIDRLMESIGNEELNTRYGYDWDAINEAVKRNEKRLYVSHKSTDHDENGYEIVPKIHYNAANTDGAKKDRPDRDQEDQHNAVDADFLMSTNALAASILNRKRKREEKLKRSQNASIKMLRGRSPSAIGEGQWTWHDIIDDITFSERSNLIKSSIHPPFPSVNDSDHEMDDDSFNATAMSGDCHHCAEDSEPQNIVCGALRLYGSTHLWEQTMHMTSKQSGSQKLALRQAAKERATPRSERVEMGEKKNRTKTKWTEDINDDSNYGMTIDRDDQAANRWLEMDLGECTLQTNNSLPKKGDEEGVHSKRMLAFRSLELALKFSGTKVIKY